MNTLPDACSPASAPAVVDQGRVAGDRDGPERRARGAERVARNGLAVAVAVERERPAQA